MSVVIETTVGDITVDLFLNERPNACLNFLKLCKIKYYNLCVFYKVERNFIAQTGDPTSTGRGGESIFSQLYGNQAAYFDAELKPRLKHEKLGTLSMVNNGNNMHGSQFFLTLGENITYLDEVHTVFGVVTEGFDVLLKINEAICDPNNRPYQDIRITHTVILHDPYDDPAGLEIPDASPLPTKEMLDSGYIGADEEIDDTKGKSVEEVEEKIKESEAKARATILEMVGDIPDADVKPPENVLFICKLNPVTTAEDLEVIFSRFGSIVSCEVIKDQKTGESLQYAFIEFEKEEDCENAYFKMDNVLIDDRRIHVDFSQSVSKMKWDSRKGGKEKPQRNQNFLIKGYNKKSDGYDMIFDHSKSSVSDKSKESEHRNSHKSKYTEYSRKRDISGERNIYKDNPKRNKLEFHGRPKHSIHPDYEYRNISTDSKSVKEFHDKSVSKHRVMSPEYQKRRPKDFDNTPKTSQNPSKSSKKYRYPESESPEPYKTYQSRSTSRSGYSNESSKHNISKSKKSFHSKSSKHHSRSSSPLRKQSRYVSSSGSSSESEYHKHVKPVIKSKKSDYDLPSRHENYLGNSSSRNRYSSDSEPHAYKKISKSSKPSSKSSHKEKRRRQSSS